MKNEIIYDGPIRLATGSSRKSVNWKTQQRTWGELIKKLKTTKRTEETSAEWAVLPKAKRDEIKDVGGFVGGTLKGGRRKAADVQERSLLTLDLDNVTPADDPWAAVCFVLGCAAVMYSTHSHTEAAPRLRLIIPLKRSVTPDEYVALGHIVASDIGIDLMDDTTYEPARLMYWPSTSKDAPYVFQVADEPWLDPDAQLARYKNWQDPTEWPVSSRRADLVARVAKKQQDPTTKDGIIGAFCRVYDVETAIERFLPETYVPYQDGRYTYTGGSTVGGLVIYEGGKFAYSHHGTDPAGGELCNAFDLVRLHLFADQDETVAVTTPTVSRPSFRAMRELAEGDEDVKKELLRASFEQMDENAEAIEKAPQEPTSDDWRKNLALNKMGRPEETVDNAVMILKNDPRLKGAYFYDVFRDRATVCGDLPWIKLKDRKSTRWDDDDDAGVRWYIERVYGIRNKDRIKDAVDLSLLQLQRDPVKEYLDGLKWDGKKRADSLFIDYLDAEDTPYTRAVTRKALIGAVARVFQPGCQHDSVIVLVGPQGCRKSTTIAKLAGEYFSDSLYTFSGKEAAEQIQGYWLIELSEMAPARKVELETMKAFITKRADSYRAAYARRKQEHPRRCAFFGTSNEQAVLKDDENRRFWPVKVTEKGAVLGEKLTKDIVDQIWAEIVAAYKAGEKWHLERKMEKAARDEQAKFTQEHPWEDAIKNFLEEPVPEDWNDRNAEDRATFLNFGGEAKAKRDRVCAREIWAECLKGRAKDMKKADVVEINKIISKIPGWKYTSTVRLGAPYGTGKGFKRSEHEAAKAEEGLHGLQN